MKLEANQPGKDQDAGKVYCLRPRCPGCDGDRHKIYGGHDQGDGSRLAYAMCLECGRKFKIIYE